MVNNLFDKKMLFTYGTFFFFPLVIIMALWCFVKDFYFYGETVSFSQDFLMTWADMIGQNANVLGEFLYILFRNTLTMSILWAVAIFWFYFLSRSKKITASRAYRYVCFLFGLFLVKEGVRMAVLVIKAGNSFRLNPLHVLFTLVFPHGILEMLAFILVIVFATKWFQTVTYNKELYWSPIYIKYVASPILCLVIAAFIEAAVTHHVFKYYLLSLVA